MTDIFADWKTNRFIVADSVLTDTSKHVIILADFKFWANKSDELVQWCIDNPKARLQGMTVEIEDDKTLTHFILRWS